MDDVKWIKLKVGMFDGASFKKIKRAKIGGESFRDKLTAIWFELMDFAGKCNHSGAFVDRKEIPYTDLEDIAIMIDREVDELQLCMSFYINEGMVEIVDDMYQLTNWVEYQNEAGLEKIRENRRNRQARWREKKKLQAAAVDDVDGGVDTTQASTGCLPSYSPSSSTSISEDRKEDRKGECEGEGKRINYQRIMDLYNEICVSYPRVRSLSEARKKTIKARMNTYTEDDFRILFEKAEASSFMKGQNKRKWRATFDWMICDANMAKVLDGNYDDSSGSHGQDSDYGNPEDFYNE